MKRCKLIVLVLLSVFLTSEVCLAADQANPVLGTWNLVSYKIERSDGSVKDLYGPSPLGVLIYDATGHMSVHLLRPDLPKCGTIDRRRCPDAQAREAFNNYAGYWGRYEVSPAEKVVYHHVEGASWPDFVGTSQKRFVEIAGNRLTITTPPLQIGGVESIGVLVWERAD